MRKVIVCFLLLFSAFIFADNIEASAVPANMLEIVDQHLDNAFRARLRNLPLAKKETFLALEGIQKLSKPGDLEARAYYYLGSAYYYHSYADSALYYFKLSEDIALKNNYYRILGYIYHLSGTLYNAYYGDQLRTIEYYNKSIHYSLMANNNRSLGAVYSDLSILLRNSGAYEKALEYIFRARESYKKTDFLEGEAWVLYLIGVLYGNTELYEEALSSFAESLEMYREIAKKDQVMSGVANCLDQMGSISLRMKDIDLARKYNKEALELNRQSGSKLGLSVSLKYLADIEFADGNYDIALQALDTALSLKESIRNVSGMTGIYELYGMILSAQQENASALEMLNIGMEYAIQNNQLRNMAEISGYLSNVYRSFGDYYQAYIQKSRQVAISDSIYSAASTRKIIQSEAMLQIEGQEQQIRELEHENRLRDLSLAREQSIRRYLHGIILLSLIILGMFIYMYYSSRKINKELVESKKHVDSLNATKDKFFSIIAHDLRSPFNSILGLSSLLLKKQRDMDADEREKMISAVNESAQSSFSLLNSLLEWARTQSGSIPFDPQNISLKESVNEVMQLLAPLADEKKISLQNGLEDVTVYADKNMLYSILRNLLSNALKYSHVGSKVRICLKEEGQWLRICVHDEGIGIPRAVREKLFNVGDFYQTPGTAGEAGSGLGLVISKEFVEKHGGIIGVESEPGKGACFYFTIKKA